MKTITAILFRRHCRSGLKINVRRYRFYSHLASNKGGTGCPFTSKKGICPVIKPSSKVMSVNPQIYRSNKKLFSADADISNHPLYPQRDGMSGDITWREVPDYSVANRKYVQQRKGKWNDTNSLESVVSNLVKTLGMLWLLLYLAICNMLYRF